VQEALEVGRENFEVQNRDYELGRASQLDALTALAQWQRLERRAAAADVQARASLVRLHVAAGGAAP
jgi:outer membrane protein TolC